MKKKKNNDGHKATIETMINSVAIALTAFGTSAIIAQNYYGFIVILFGVFLEFIKYYGRSKGLW